MGKKVSLILGNGFTIDFLLHMANKSTFIKDKIDVTNLFRNGDLLKWPADDRPGFLSYKNCPNLWNIGARANLNATDAMTIVERVVTSANVYSLKGNDNIEEKTGNGFLHAYKELVYYLKYLFIHYDGCIEGDFSESLTDWSWYGFFKNLAESEDVEEVNIVTYNYDIWLERILKSAGIDFDLPLLSDNRQAKFKIFKPHGSISYHHKAKLPKESFEINYRTFSLDCPLTDIVIDYEGLDRHTPMNFIIPPAGESGRARSNWAQGLRNECISKMKVYESTDLAIISGISYWHVDRAEIDSILVSLNEHMEVINVNPNPSSAFDSVLNSLFKNYIHMTKSDFLKEFKV